MDMSVKLNLSYPPVAPQGATPPVAGSPEKPKADAGVSAVSEPKRADLEKAVTDIRDFVQATQRKLDFSIDDSTHQIVVKVIATETGEVIRQIPSETALKLAQSLHDASSLLFDGKA
ncbi:flagellar biosynthesis protein FlaG [Pseudomonas sp. FW306-02-F02-AA]|uniref:Flagellar biosynthesis protein FlaG n=1 Tax=Pseudomonas fluorescens TaxID=294 RepID=A0A0N9WK96_PSEFL|nr:MULTISPECIES: flagellar protein FlaG [Pseudomonas]ALI02997.1 flagellar biosynthesis protein FlaG [Pseudomonas fluorescens]PMZ04148.1 flagellar biosynthesis protein FlaG [Pseudomonas sp. FW306-02-F02-AB]PMZ10303.1 flagellar biosynthesis protein FlaG [Pseudomonas sp. FW306-02-H06C]PMZ15730.1 flagellar biosynthesis protein FlaG [Pseudomonas sp. FW306-02-F02-AA]PMZ20907.1 flagellar biosynthesis protein FlaG [Pseudomonas sp. FW306-02-F08-AA]